MGFDLQQGLQVPLQQFFAVGFQFSAETSGPLQNGRLRISLFRTPFRVVYVIFANPAYALAGHPAVKRCATGFANKLPCKQVGFPRFLTSELPAPVCQEGLNGMELLHLYDWLVRMSDINLILLTTVHNFSKWYRITRKGFAQQLIPHIAFIAQDV